MTHASRPKTGSARAPGQRPPERTTVSGSSLSGPLADAVVWRDEAHETESRRLWAAVMLTADLRVCRSILEGRPVLARQLDGEALKRALRGEPLPDPDSYFRVRPGHLDAIAEGGAFTPLSSESSRP
jgi:hypothetical protein